MIRVVLSPSKAMDFAPTTLTERTSSPVLLEESEPLIELMQAMSASDIGKLMKLSDKLSELNYTRFQQWDAPKTPQKQAILAFTGDTYKDIPLKDYTADDFDEAQARVRILSGLYGLLRPLDLIAPYRLEMGTRLKNTRGKTLYDYWGDRVQRALIDSFGDTPEDERVLVNCASNEYFKVLQSKTLKARQIEPVFKDAKPGKEHKVISFYAKRARGMMADFIVRERVYNPDDIVSFDVAGYRYDEASSTPDSPVFLRDHG
jgi:cytoplasmic iron level regulating protein YaaA (DUF328/UPF0246 family)